LPERQIHPNKMMALLWTTTDQKCDITSENMQ
jgi:hypothetical protein